MLIGEFPAYDVQLARFCSFSIANIDLFKFEEALAVVLFYQVFAE